MRALPVVFAAVLVGLLASPAPSTLAQVVECNRDRQTGEISCVVIAPVETPNEERTSGGGGDPGPPLRWTKTRIYDSLGAPPSCERTVDSIAGPIQEFGIPWLIVVQNLETGEYIRIRLQCQFSGDAPPPLPPEPPTITDILSDVDVGSAFALDTGISPPVSRRGVSQLPTWLWCSAVTPIDVVAEVAPYRASARAVVANVTWTITGPDGIITESSDDCGSEPDLESNGAVAAATWTPNLPGVSTIALTTTWTAQWTYTYLSPSGPVVLGTFDFGALPYPSEPFAYEVYEIQTVGVPNP